MALDLRDCRFQGPALPEPFVKFELEKELTKLKLLPKATAMLKNEWEVYRRILRELAASGGAMRVRHHVVDPLLPLLGYSRIDDGGSIETREGSEDAGQILLADDGSKLRVWTASFDEDLYAPTRRGAAFRFSHLRRAQRVLLAAGERAGLVTNGAELMFLISDPARPESTVTFNVDPEWKRSRELPDSFRLLIALSRPEGVQKLADIIDKARLQQARVTKELRKQAKRAIESFIQGVIDHPANKKWRERENGNATLAKELWHEGLILVYRLLFILKLESSDDPARSFSFASTSLWRNTFSPSIALAPYVRQLLDRGADTGGLLENGLRTLFHLFEQGLECTELVVKPLGGALFGKSVMPILSERVWGERSVAHLLDQILWTTPARSSESRERVHYGPLDVEDLGRVYEALLELEPGIATEPMCRVRRQKLEVVVPLVQGERYRPVAPTPVDESEDNDADELEDDEEATSGRRARVEWVEAIARGTFYLRVGLGRKATGSYYTPHSFVRFLVQEALGPQVAERSPANDPNPLAILKLKVLDPAMGSGHFLVEACRFLGEKLYEACRLCDEKALAAERDAEQAKGQERGRLIETASDWRQRVIDLPDPEDVLLNYLPSRSPEGEESGLSQRIALAICRRLVATHCLYGVDKNPLAVELAKLALWLESHAEGMPLTFLDHRLIVGDSVTGPFWEKLIFRPSNAGEPIANLFHNDLDLKLTTALTDALRLVRELESTVGASAAEVESKQRAKQALDCALFPFQIAAAAWSGGAMLGARESDDAAFASLLQTIVTTGNIPVEIGPERLRQMIGLGVGLESIPPDREWLRETIRAGNSVPALGYDLTFPEVFYPRGSPHVRHGFDSVIGNPPWKQDDVAEPDFWAAIDPAILSLTSVERQQRLDSLSAAVPSAAAFWSRLVAAAQARQRLVNSLFRYQVADLDGDLTSGKPDVFKQFAERSVDVCAKGGRLGLLFPSSFHNNEGATGLRKRYLDDTRLVCCYSFINRRRLFEIDSRQKFAAIVAERGGRTESFKAKFYLEDDEWLFAATDHLTYDRQFLAATGGTEWIFIECREQVDVDIVKAVTPVSESWAALLGRFGVSLSQGFSSTRDAWRRVRLDETEPRDLYSRSYHEEPCYVVHEGKTISDYRDQGDSPITECVPMSRLGGAHWRQSIQYFRVGQRRIASSTNERTSIFAILPPGCVCLEKVRIETEPASRPMLNALIVCAIGNSFSFDWLTRLRVGTTASEFLIDEVPVFKAFHETALRTFLAHSVLQLVCNSTQFYSLWQEQLGAGAGSAEWRTPLLDSEIERLRVRAAVDAVVAAAYGLNRDQYEHVLSGFNHSRAAALPGLCLDGFNEVQSTGMTEFAKKHDPYWDRPLHLGPPFPAFQFPDTPSSVQPGEHQQLTFPGGATQTGTRKARSLRRTR